MTFPQRARVLLRTSPVTVGFILLCVVVYIINVAQTRSLTDTLGQFSYRTDEYGRFVEMLDRSIGWDLIFSEFFVHDLGQWWRIFTAAVVHLDIAHLLMNMLLIFLLGREVERAFGAVTMLCAIVAGAAGGALACMVWGPDSPMGGASTVGYALCALLIAVVAQRSQSLSGPIVLIVVNLGFSLTMPGVSLWGHVGGLLAGCALAAVMYSPKASRTLAVLIAGVTALVAVAVGLG